MKKQSLLLDGHKLHYHPQRVAAFMDGRDVAPVYAEVSPSANCNHRCLFCNFSHLGHRGRFPQGRMLSLMDEISEAGIKSVVFAGSGEPTLHPDTLAAIEKARKAGMDVALSTNGTLLNDEAVAVMAGNLTWIRFSFNAGSPESYARIHGTDQSDYVRVLDNIRKTRLLKDRIGSGLTIGTQFVLLPENMDQVIAMAEKMKECGADYFVVKHFYRSETNRYSPDMSFPPPELMATVRSAASRLSDGGFSFMVRHEPGLAEKRSYSRCYGLPFIVYFREDCRVYTCFLHQHDDRTSLGSIERQSFTELWKSRGKKEAIDYINGGIDKGTCQENCRHHRINAYLWDLRHCRPDHVNFI